MWWSAGQVAGVDQVLGDETDSERVVGKVADVRQAGAMRDLVDLAVARFGGLDIVVTWAGVQRYGTVEDTPEDVWDEVLDINLKGVYLTCKAAIPS